MTEFKHSRPVVLMYHRIARSGLDPWRLRVAPEQFEQQIISLRTEFDFISLTDLERQNINKPSIMVTFDDGYLDNLAEAKPILDKHGIPAIVFITTGYIDSKQEYWWDELEQIFLQPGQLPPKLNLKEFGINFERSLAESRSYSLETAHQHAHWFVKWDGTPPPTERHQLFYDVWEALSVSESEPRENALCFLFDWAERERLLRDSHRLMNSNEILELASGGLVDIGSHGISHTDMSTLDPKAVKTELFDSRSELQSLLGRPVSSLAYPHGRFNDEVKNLARKAGYHTAFSAQPDSDPSGSDCLKIPRLMAIDQEPGRLLNRVNKMLASQRN